jgi:hypothetical protein
MYPYASEQHAMTDVLRLSRGMTYKAAICGLPYGGGKSVIIADPRRDKTPAAAFTPLFSFARPTSSRGAWLHPPRADVTGERCSVTPTTTAMRRSDPIPHGRDAQRPEFAVGLGIYTRLIGSGR